MKGLLIKELELLKNSMRTQVFMILLFAVMGILMKNVAYTGMMVTILITNLTLVTISHDEASSWNRYAMTLPIRRENLISAKFALVYLLTAVGVAFTVLLGIPLSAFTEIPFSECVATVLACAAMALFATSLNLLLCMKFGMEKARIMTTLTYLIPCVGVFALYYLVVKKQMFDIDLNRVTEREVYLALAVVLAVIVALSILCYRLSCHVIKKQDL